MLSALAIALLALSPSMAGPPLVAVHGSTVIDYTASIFLTGPATAAQCTDAAVTTDQGNAITVSRASSAYCQKTDGTYVLVGSNKLVVEPDGLRVEPGSTNRVAFSEALNGNWTATTITKFQNIADPAGGGTAEEFDDTSSGGNLKSPTFTITGTSAVLSAWYNHSGVVDGILKLRDTTASADRCTITLTHLTGNFTGTMAARSNCNSSGIVSGNNHQVWFYPGGTGGSASGVSVWGVQVEPGLVVKTSYIPTSGTAASRASDDVSITVTDFDGRGCVRASVTNTTSTYQGGVVRWFNASGGSPLGTTATTTLSMHDNATAATLTVSDVSNRTTTARSQWSGTSMFIESGGSTGTAGTFDGTMGTGGVLTLGSSGAGGAAIGAWMKAIKYSTSPGGCQ